MFDEETEQLAAELGLDVAFPPAALRHRMDSKIETTRLGNEAGVPSVPNTMGRGTDYRGAAAARGDRGPRRGPRRADPVRRLRADDVLHRERGRLAGGREEDRRPRHQGDAADRAARARDRGRDHASRHAGRAADGRAHRVPRAHALRRRLVRQRRLARAAHRAAAARRARANDRDGGTPAARGVPRLLRARFPARCGDRRPLARRAQPAGHRGQQHHERYRGRVRRHAAVPVPSVGVHGRRLRDRRRRAERAMGPDP